MIPNRSVPPASVIPELPYADVAEAADWLCSAFGFRQRFRIGDHRAQLVYADGAVIVTRLREGEPRAAAAVLVRVEDADSHHEQAASHGAQILQPPADYPMGRGNTRPPIPAGTTGRSRSRSTTSTRRRGERPRSAFDGLDDRAVHAVGDLVRERDGHVGKSRSLETFLVLAA